MSPSQIIVFSQTSHEQDVSVDVCRRFRDIAVRDDFTPLLEIRREEWQSCPSAPQIVNPLLATSFNILARERLQMVPLDLDFEVLCERIQRNPNTASNAYVQAAVENQSLTTLYTTSSVCEIRYFHMFQDILRQDNSCVLLCGEHFSNWLSTNLGNRYRAAVPVEQEGYVYRFFELKN